MRFSCGETGILLLELSLAQGELQTAPWWLLGELRSWSAQSCCGGAGGRAGVVGALGRGDLGKWFRSSTEELVLAPGAFLRV